VGLSLSVPQPGKSHWVLILGETMSTMYDSKGNEVHRLIDRYGKDDTVNILTVNGKEYYGQVASFDTIGIAIYFPKTVEQDVVIPWTAIERVLVF